MADDNYTIIKICILGPDNSGKSSLLLRFTVIKYYIFLLKDN